MKIVYVINSIASKGGAERIIIEKMNYFAVHCGYDVSVICCYQNDSMPNAYPLSVKVKQIYMGIPYYSQYYYSYPYRLLVKKRINNQLKEGLRKKINSIDPDVIVGVSYFAADVVSSIRCRARKVIEAHEPRLFTLSNKGSNRSILSSLFMSLYKRFYFRLVEKRADVVVTLTHGDAYEWRRAKHVEVIPNFTQMTASDIKKGENKRVIAVGRLEWEKGFDRLIDAWRSVAIQHPDWCLDIFGTGSLRDDLEKQIKTLELSDKVHLRLFTSNINKEYEKSDILVSPSHFEGFSLAILEAMRLGVPSVAFDCPYGPQEVIEDGVCGYLVPDGDGDMLAQKICELIDNPDIRKAFSEASLRHAEKFNMDAVMRKWQTLFETGHL